MSTPAPHALSFVEDILLLSLDDDTGALLPLPVMGLDYALAGALLADLALANRIDTDPNQLVVLDHAPIGDPLLDRALGTITTSTSPQPVSHWLGVFASERATLERAALERLVARGILRQEEKKFLWVFGLRRYPTVDNQERTEVRTRLSALILGDELPDPRDAVLISLLTACHLLARIFDESRYHARSERIATLARMDLVGREVAAAIDTLSRVLRSATPVMGM
ncbi:MAG: GPP34 family phosphoprotein [Burkholderiales bacterium]|nr:GPP34 family phosphoprotein [Opitutaceae bacterium]